MVSIMAELSFAGIHDGPLPLDSMLDLWQRRLWTRVWAVQEFAAAQELYLVCGNRKLKFIHFFIIYCLFFSFMFDHDHDLLERLDEISVALHALSPIVRNIINVQPQISPSLKDLLQSVNRLGATDPRDRVFAVLGLANDAQLLGICADYSKPYSEICVETAWRMLRQYGLWILSESSAFKSAKRQKIYRPGCQTGLSMMCFPWSTFALTKTWSFLLQALP